MSSDVLDDAEFSISGAWGEVYYVDPLGVRQPRRIWEVSAFNISREKASTQIQLAGNEQGDKDGPVTNAGSMTVRKIDDFLENIVIEEFPGNVSERRQARDSGTRRGRGFVLQLWLDDPDALGALGYEVGGVRMRRMEQGFDLSQVVTNREHPFTFKTFKRLKSFEKVGNQVDPTTGMPSIKYLTPDNG